VGMRTSHPDGSAERPIATLMQIQLFMDVTRSFMESVDWVERYFYFGAMYDMRGVNPLNSMFDIAGRERRTGALNAYGRIYTPIRPCILHAQRVQRPRPPLSTRNVEHRVERVHPSHIVHR
jgi:hypothetical protein